jgi:hypothetical protein
VKNLQLLSDSFTQPVTAIRAVKNLRISEGFHSAFKLLSWVYSREIIATDRARYHHFRTGTCSCKDFWWVMEIAEAFCSTTSLEQCRISTLIRPCICNQHLVITPYGLTWVIVLQKNFERSLGARW